MCNPRGRTLTPEEIKVVQERYHRDLDVYALGGTVFEIQRRAKEIQRVSDERILALEAEVRTLREQKQVLRERLAAGRQPTPRAELET